MIDTTAVILAASGADKPINLKGSWTTFWNAISNAAGMGGLLRLAAVIGVALVVFAVVKWAWDRRRGEKGSFGAIWGALVIGLILSAPNVAMPIAFTLLDAIANAGIAVWNRTAG